MLICGENVNSCSVQRRVQTHVQRFHTFACDAVGLQCWVNLFVCVAFHGKDEIGLSKPSPGSVLNDSGKAIHKPLWIDL